VIHLEADPARGPDVHLEHLGSGHARADALGVEDALGPSGV
jgi:hypothetical protein